MGTDISADFFITLFETSSFCQDVTAICLAFAKTIQEI